MTTYAIEYSYQETVQNKHNCQKSPYVTAPDRNIK